MGSFTLNFSNGTLIVEGPATITVASGQCEVLGYPVNGSLSVERFRVLPIFARGSCTLSVSGGSVRYVDGSTIPSDWDELNLEGIALIVGDIDSGKTTLTTYLLNKHVIRGLSTCVIDADVGQSSIGPPGVIGLSCVGLPTPTLEDLHMMSGFFIGCNSPSQCIGRFIGGVSTMVREAFSRTPGLVLVDMPGWVGDGGIELIRNVVDAVGADYVVSIGINLRLRSGVKVINVSRSKYVRPRDSDERRFLRNQALRRYLSGELVNVNIELNKIIGNSVIECIVNNCGHYVIDNVAKVTRHGSVVKVPSRLFNNVFIGLVRRGFLVGFGVIKEFNLKEGIANALVTTDYFEEAVMGRLRVDPEKLEEIEPFPLL
ncbi:GTPase or GTP-binding protein [Vulcanisaeta moutnovskia 768-28]|uniref:polynucleotide 5'-hydroxyl-kinase n=1 Tax=Vulcanisaeta moutnovskia (strain 768-28) TaxID=985053 RepID=F0QTB8_VULM7|nr:Clp1/GlmU family protein [Vulcanisaeta moutnovskia]ADY00460.1 GTPase or GTP-binding protein [Vulcanisaeta moutnovskia 768-28]